MRKGDVKNVASLHHGGSEAIEIVAHGDLNTSNIVGKTIRNIRLPSGCIIGAILRNNEVIIGHKNVEIQDGDHVIVYLGDKKAVSEIEKLFQPSSFFI